MKKLSFQQTLAIVSEEINAKKGKADGMNPISGIPGSKPPTTSVSVKTSDIAFLKKNGPVSEDPQLKKLSFQQTLQQFSSVKSMTDATPQDQVNGFSDHLDNILNRPTAEVVQEAVAVGFHCVDEAKTVGGLGGVLLTFGALIAASPWSWIAALVFGPARVYNFFCTAVVAGIKSFPGVVLMAILLFGVLTMLFVGWLIFRLWA